MKSYGMFPQYYALDCDGKLFTVIFNISIVGIIMNNNNLPNL